MVETALREGIKMKQYLHAIILYKIILFAAGASALENPTPETPIDDLYFSNDNPTLTPNEKAAIAIGEKFKATSETALAPVPGANGAIKFVYGGQQASIVCAVLQVCDVILQVGERVNTINMGDSVRWMVEPAITGSGVGEVQHLIIKPLDVGIETSMVVTTNRRTYHFRLRSHRTQYMPQVVFTYPEDAMAKWEAIKTREVVERQKKVEERQEKTMSETGEYLGNMRFDYTVSGRAIWKPVRVYNDGIKTIIQMPSVMVQTEAPTLLVVRKDGGLFTDDEMVLVNYRVQGNRYIVDTIFDKAILIAGVGSGQDRITIQRGK